MFKKDKKRSKHELPTSFLTDDSEIHFDEADLEKELLTMLGTKGLTEDPSLESDEEEVNENDPKLIAELEAFVSGVESDSKVAKHADFKASDNVKKQGVTLMEIDALVAAYYGAIESLDSTDTADQAKLRRYQRTLDRLQSLSQDVANGHVVWSDELPPAPPVLPSPTHAALSQRKLDVSSAVPTRGTSGALNTTAVPELKVNAEASASSTSGLVALNKRCTEYKLAAIKARDAGQIARAKELLTAAKFIESMVPKIESGEESFDPTTDMPPPPEEYASANEGSPSIPSASMRDSPSHMPTQVIQNTPNTATGLTTSSPDGLTALKQRFQEYKLAAIKARDAGEIAKAKELLTAVKFIESMVPKIESGEESFDPKTDMPPPPEEYASTTEESAADTSAPSSSAHGLPPQMASALSSEVTAENLKLRRQYYQTVLENSQSDAPKARRLSRVLDRYDKAMQAFEHGLTSFNFTDLPPPPGCPPLGSLRGTQSAGVAPATPGTGKNEKAVALLKTRQMELKAAALKAKEAGNTDLAKTHLRAALGMNAMIESAEAGLPVDLSQLPRVPTSSNVTQDSGSTMVFKGPVMTGISCDPPLSLRMELDAASNETERHRVLLTVLKNQAEEAGERAETLARAGISDVSKKLNDLAQLSKSSISFLSASLKQNRPLSYEFEWANIPQLNFNHDLGDGILEVCVVRGISFPLPSDIASADKLQTQVELQLSFPSSENPQKHSTSWIKQTRDPVYDSAVQFKIEPRSRTYQLLLKSKRALKASVYYSRGMLRRPHLLGTVSFQLDELSRSVTFTLVGDLMDGRKAVGGRLELRLRQRSVGSGAQMTCNRKPWLILSVPKSSNPAPPQRQTRLEIPQPHANPSGERSPGSKVILLSGGKEPVVSTADGTVSRQLRYSSSSPHSNAVKYDHSGRNNSATPLRNERHLTSENLYSLEVMKDDQRQFSKRLMNPELSREDRDKYQSRLTWVNQLIARLESRLQGSNADREIPLYVDELNALMQQTRDKYNHASAENDQASMAHYNHRIELIKHELSKYTTRRQPRSAT